MLYKYTFRTVAPRRGAWIEIVNILRFVRFLFRSLPAGERGLKFCLAGKMNNGGVVAPRRGAWIEIKKSLKSTVFTNVAPRRGAWIEIA